MKWSEKSQSQIPPRKRKKGLDWVGARAEAGVGKRGGERWSGETLETMLESRFWGVTAGSVRVWPVWVPSRAALSDHGY